LDGFEGIGDEGSRARPGQAFFPGAAVPGHLQRPFEIDGGFDGGLGTLERAGGCNSAMAMDLRSLVGKLDNACRTALEQAAELALSRTDFNVEIEHWLIKLLEIRDGDLAKILSRYQVDIGRLRADLHHAIDRLGTGNARTPGLSPNLVALVSKAWHLASIDLGAAQVRSGHLLLALVGDETLRMAVPAAAGQLAHISADGLQRDFRVATEGSSEPGTAGLAIDLKSLIGKLDDPCRTALEQAAALALSRANFNVEIEHWLLRLLEIKDGDLAKILPRYGVDIGGLTADLNRAIDRFSTGSGGAPALAPSIVTLAIQGWLRASIDLGASRVRSGHLLLALLGDETLSRAVREEAGQLARIPVEELKREFAVATEGSSERRAVALVAAAVRK
jgi:ATP-dependent Clp protease ATP-binding subunit ClpA